MDKYKVVIFILLIAFFLIPKAYCQQAVPDRQVNTIDGKVTFVDVPGNVISVQTKNGTMVFDIEVESDLLRDAHHIATLEIEKGDPVIIEYVRDLVGKNKIITLQDKKPDSL